MNMSNNYTSPNCEVHVLRQVQILCDSEWHQNGSSSKGYDYYYDEEYELY
jgi:hypothetical protein